MPPTPPPAPLTPAPLERWQHGTLFSPAAVLLAALIAALINWQILHQRSRAYERALEQKRESDRKALEAPGALNHFPLPDGQKPRHSTWCGRASPWAQLRTRR
jgi:hypothetical protein